MSEAEAFPGGDPDRTRLVRPNPGGRLDDLSRPARQSPAPPPPPAPPMAEGARRAALDQAVAMVGANHVVTAAMPLLVLAIALRGSGRQDDIAGLRDRVVQEISGFEKRLYDVGLDAEGIRMARYAMCATIDDLVMATPWGSHGIWARESMVVTFHGEAWGGERFFDILEFLQRNPGASGDVLELLFVCLAIGFEGRFRVQPRGAAELHRVREGLYRTIRGRRGEFERDLSPHWRGLEVGFLGIRRILPLWVLCVGALSLLALLFALFTYLLNGESDSLFADLGSLARGGPVTIARAAPAPPPPKQDDGRLERFRKFLAPEIAEGLVTVFEDNQAVTVRIRNSGMFKSGSSEVDPRFYPLLQRIGDALEAEKGPTIVRGYTDNQPIRSLRFPSNWHLSVARADAVTTRLRTRLTDSGRVSSEGRAEADPIAPNTTPEGRELNRRTEIVLVNQSSPASPTSSAQPGVAQ